MPAALIPTSAPTDSMPTTPRRGAIRPGSLFRHPVLSCIFANPETINAHLDEVSMVRILLVMILSSTPLLAQPILVDHTSIALFERIPRQWIDSASRLRMAFMDRSVGGNINEALGCLSQPWESAPNFCKRHQHRDSAYAVDPSEVRWSGIWDRSRWRYEYWPSGCSEDANCFVAWIEPRIDSFDVVGFQHSYLGVAPGTRLHDPVDGYFGAKTDRGTATSYAAFAARHPDKTVIWWTSSLARGIGSTESQQFNEVMRGYARTNSVALFDVADILSHDPAGRPCYDNRDGVAYLTENHPDDGLSIPAICPQYTTETDGGHLGSISAGGIRVAKAFWVLMARIAGWNGIDTASRIETAAPGNGGLVVRAARLANDDGIVVSWDGAIHGDGTIELFDVRGERLASYALSEWHLNGALRIPTPADRFPNGWYMVRAKFDQGSVSAEVLIVR